MTAQPILILTQAYPSQGNPYQMAFVHARVKQYLVMGQPVKVLSFAAKQDYRFEGVEVVTLQSAEQSGLFKAATVVSHAPNLRNHIRFILKNRKKISRAKCWAGLPTWFFCPMTGLKPRLMPA